MLWLEITNSRHAVRDFILEWDHALPSGSPPTTISNTIYVNLAMRLAFELIKKENDCESYDFDSHVTCFAFGDDHVLSVSDHCPWFNYQTIQATLGKYGLKYTDESKSDVLPKYKSIDEVTFLKRSFRYEDGIYLSPLDLDVIVQMPYWYRKGDGQLDRVEENMNNALKELSQHPVS